MLKLGRRIEDNANKKTQLAAREFLTTVVNETPADKGQAISSWKVGLNYQPRGTRLFVEGTKGSTAASNRAAVLSAELPKIEQRVTGMTIYIVNTAPYITLLNQGRSNQAQAGFIDKARSAAIEASRKQRLLD